MLPNSAWAHQLPTKLPPPARWHRFRFTRGMAASFGTSRATHVRESIGAEILVVRIPESITERFSPDAFTRAGTGLVAMQMLKLVRFRLLLASLDVPDMRPWELFSFAKTAQPSLKCVLVDHRFTLKHEQLAREAGAAVFDPSDEGIFAVLAGALPRIPPDVGTGTRVAIRSTSPSPPGPKAGAPPERDFLGAMNRCFNTYSYFYNTRRRKDEIA